MRIEYGKVAPEGMKALLALGRYAHDSGLETSLLELVYMRASQINGCVFCLDMHAKKLRKEQMDVDKLLQLPVWWESPHSNAHNRLAIAFRREPGK